METPQVTDLDIEKTNDSEVTVYINFEGEEWELVIDWYWFIAGKALMPVFQLIRVNNHKNED